MFLQQKPNIAFQLSKPIYQRTREMCQIVQDVRTCLIRHTKGPGKCVGLYRCQNLSNLTHQGTRKMCQIVQDVRTCLIRHTKGPGKCVRLYRMSEYSGFILVNRYILGPNIFVGCHKTQMSDCTSSTVVSFIIYFQHDLLFHTFFL